MRDLQPMGCSFLTHPLSWQYLAPAEGIGAAPQTPLDIRGFGWGEEIGLSIRNNKRYVRWTVFVSINRIYGDY